MVLPWRRSPLRARGVRQWVQTALQWLTQTRAVAAASSSSSRSNSVAVLLPIAAAATPLPASPAAVTSGLVEAGTPLPDAVLPPWYACTCRMLAGSAVAAAAATAAAGHAHPHSCGEAPPVAPAEGRRQPAQLLNRGAHAGSKVRHQQQQQRCCA
jgi:hypothetical protein